MISKYTATVVELHNAYDACTIIYNQDIIADWSDTVICAAASKLQMTLEMV